VREGLSRLPPALVLIAFCLPLFIGLGSFDLDSDEAIYSYAVESILTGGDWLSPRSSPNPDDIFLEKPHLKLWIVAAPIRLGLLPLNEFGLRFWDALFGALSFVYLFLIGRRLAGWVCGLAAALVLFAHTPLIFDHGFRSNNMDAALVLAYCGGVYHYLRWASAPAGPSRIRHIAAVLAWFYLGFMTKFVAAIFLPAHRRATGRLTGGAGCSRLIGAAVMPALVRVPAPARGRGPVAGSCSASMSIPGSPNIRSQPPAAVALLRFRGLAAARAVAQRDLGGSSA
jgi:hypothetical protein